MSVLEIRSGDRVVIGYGMAPYERDPVDQQIANWRSALATIGVTKVELTLVDTPDAPLSIYVLRNGDPAPDTSDMIGRAP